tara:strand:+ start:392 stop:946 length:555 start_codon:yes stop_codon:yes gene_type:complete
MFDISLPAFSVMLQVLLGMAGPIDTGEYLYPAVDIHGEFYCLAVNAYHEARGASFDEKIATSQVVMNRVDSKRYPHTICEVITEGPIKESWKTRKDPTLEQEDRVYYPTRNRCQFSWYCDGRSDDVNNLDGWEDSVIAAYIVYMGFGEDMVNGATHYYAHKKVNPNWAATMVVTAKLDGHTYLK